MTGDRVGGASCAIITSRTGVHGERAADYGAQLRLYARALEVIYRRPVTRRSLWFIHPRKLVDVP